MSLCIDDDRSRLGESLSAAHCKSLDKYSSAVLFTYIHVALTYVDIKNLYSAKIVKRI